MPELSAAAPQSQRDLPLAPTRVRTGGALFWIFAVIIPIAAIFLELIARPMASVYFDPMPTIWHFLAVCSVPAGLMITEVILRAVPYRRRWPALAAFGLNGFALALSLLYTAAYLPTFPLSVIAIIAMGVGLLGLSPLWCVIGSACQTRRLFAAGEALRPVKLSGILPLAGGLAAAVLLVVSLQVGSIAVDHGIELALEDSAAERSRGIWLIKTFGGEEQVLRRCYQSQDADAPLFLQDWDDDRSGAELGEYRKLYFRLTGRPFNSAPPPGEARNGPGLFRRRGRVRGDSWREWQRELVTDSEVGGTAVAGRVPGLSLCSSAMDASLASESAADAGPCMGYLEWTVTFRNDSEMQREARAQIVLPAGAVASRLTLWIDGEECEAAFGRRAQVRRAYRDVAVVRRRDPALLTTMGPDRVLLQCFPIQPRNSMKVKVGVSVPLLVREGKAWLRLPYFAERNFTIAPDFEHAVWVECQAPLETVSDKLKSESAASKLHAVRGRLSEAELQDPASASIALRAPDLGAGRSWTASRAKDSALMTVRKSKAEGTVRSAACIVLVLDGSACMSRLDVSWQKVVAALPDCAVVSAVFAGHTLESWRERPERLTATARRELAEWLRERRFDGGCDPVPALEAAWDLCSAGGGGDILWVHGPLPVELSILAGLQQRFERRPPSKGGPRLISVAAVPGPNRVIESLPARAEVLPVTVIQSLENTLRFAARHLSTEEVSRKYCVAAEGSALPAADFPPRKAGAHLLRLAVGEEVRSALRSESGGRRDRAAKLAVRTRLVTPLTGAVVLERKQQYQRHGLDPDADVGEEGQHVPGVPEPEEWALIFLAIAGVALLVLRKRKRAVCAH
jgi:vault protein inter-alpha-trypsin-like protein